MAHIPSGGKPGRDVEINIVPMIDVMSCLTAFLLLTAVWSTTMALNTKPSGKGRHGQIEPEEPEHVSVQVESDRVWIGNDRTGDRVVLDRDGTEWEALERHLKATIAAADRFPIIELAAESTDAEPVRYDTMIAAMDSVVRAGFPSVGLTDPHSLTVRPTL